MVDPLGEYVRGYASNIPSRLDALVHDERVLAAYTAEPPTSATFAVDGDGYAVARTPRMVERRAHFDDVLQRAREDLARGGGGGHDADAALMPPSEPRAAGGTARAISSCFSG